MKFDDQLAAYLYETKTLRLEGIGTFTLDGKVSVPREQEKEIYYPIEGLSFTYNPKSTTDENLIAFLVQKLHKIQPLVRSDLESYLSNIKQFINLGKPYTIEGVGTLSKNNQGTYEFTPGNFLPAKEELNPRRENAEHNYPVRSQSSVGRIFVIILVVVAALAALGGIGWGISNFISKSQTATTEEVPELGSIDTIPQTTDTRPAIPESTTGASDTPSTGPVTQSLASNGDTSVYKMILETTPSRQRAIRRTTQLQTLKINAKYDSLTSVAGVRYRIFVNKRLKATDTLRIRDSIAKFFLKRVTVEKD